MQTDDVSDAEAGVVVQTETNILGRVIGKNSSFDIFDEMMYCYYGFVPSESFLAVLRQMVEGFDGLEAQSDHDLVVDYAEGEFRWTYDFEEYPEKHGAVVINVDIVDALAAFDAAQRLRQMIEAIEG